MRRKKKKENKEKKNNKEGKMKKIERKYEERKKKRKFLRKQGRKKGYPSRVRVGRSSTGKSHLGRSDMLKKLKNAEKVKSGPTDQPTYRPTDISGHNGSVSSIWT